MNRGDYVRVTFTLPNELNNMIEDEAKRLNFTKSGYICHIITNHMDMLNTGLCQYSERCISTERHNARGAGRKQEFGEAHKLAMKAHRSNGLSYRDIAKIYECSVGTVYKLINEQ